MNIDPVVAFGLVLAFVGIVVILSSYMLRSPVPQFPTIEPGVTEIQLPDLEFKEGDTLVFLTERALTFDQRAAIRSMLTQGLQTGVLILEHGERLQVIKRSAK